MTDTTTKPFDDVVVGGLPFQVTDLDSAVTWLIEDVAVHHRPINVRLVNAYNVALAHEDSAYRTLMAGEGVNFPDGKPVVWFMNLGRRGARAGQVRGPSLFTAAMASSAGRGTRHFLLGSTPSTLKDLQASLGQRFPGVSICGAYSPPYADISDTYSKDCAERIAGSGADIVWLGLGTPKQDLLGTDLARRLGVATVNVGAAFDFVAGTVREAPRWVQGTGFEWMHRLASEPHRLWRRYLFGNIGFLRAALGPGSAADLPSGARGVRAHGGSRGIR